MLADLIAGKLPSDYLKDWRAFARWLDVVDEDAAFVELASMAYDDAHRLASDWVAEMRDEGKAAATIARRVSALRRVMAIARMARLTDLCIDLDRGQVEAYAETAGVSEAGVRRCLASLDRRTDPKGIRDAVVFRMIAFDGLRRGEISRLRRGDVTADGRAVIVAGKAVPLSEGTAEALARWERPAWSKWLFHNFDRASKVGQTGLTGPAIYSVLRKLSPDAGEPVTPTRLAYYCRNRVMRGKIGDVVRVRDVARLAVMDNANVFVVNAAGR